MAIIGFIVLLAVGLYFLLQAFIGAYVMTAFSGKPCWPHFIIWASIGSAVLYFAVTNSPLRVAVG